MSHGQAQVAPVARPPRQTSTSLLLLVKKSTILHEREPHRLTQKVEKKLPPALAPALAPAPMSEGSASAFSIFRKKDCKMKSGNDVFYTKKTSIWKVALDQGEPRGEVLVKQGDVHFFWKP